jgi:hypothetical protein
VGARPLFAHSWGWDEILYFAVPAVLAIFWIRWAEKRARRDRESGEDRDANMTGRDEP